MINMSQSTLSTLVKKHELDNDSTLLLAGWCLDTSDRDDFISDNNLWSEYDSLRDSDWFKQQFALEVLVSIFGYDKRFYDDKNIYEVTA